MSIALLWGVTLGALGVYLGSGISGSAESSQRQRPEHERMREIVPMTEIAGAAEPSRRFPQRPGWSRRATSPRS